MRFCQIMLFIWVRPCKAAGRKLTQCPAMSKPNALKIIWELLEHDQISMLIFARLAITPGKGGSRGFPDFGNRHKSIF